MTIDLYKALNVSKKASEQEIKDAYLAGLKKWQPMLKGQPEPIKQRIEKFISSIELAYRVLSDPKQRQKYDLKLKNEAKEARKVTEVNQQQTKEVAPHKHTPATTSAPKKNGGAPKLLLLLLLVLIIIGLLVFYYPTLKTYFPNVKGENQAATASSKTPVKQVQQAKSAKQLELQKALKEAEELKKKNANNPKLKELAKKIASAVNERANTVINSNTQFLSARASNQNITYIFIVIDGITVSPNLLKTYLLEQFAQVNNEICTIQQKNVEAGILFTMAYFNTKGKLVGSFYIDQQVCQSPKNERILKKPDINQLNSTEVTETK